MTSLGAKRIFSEFTTGLAHHSETYLSPNTSSPVELFLNVWHEDQTSTTDDSNEKFTPAELFSVRLQQLINTFWYGTYNPSSFVGGKSVKLSARNNFDPRPDLAKYFVETKAEVSYEGYRIINCQFSWLFALFLSSTAMLGAAIMGGIFSLRTRGPDILGRCSTLLRDTLYIRDSRAGSTLDGYDRTRKLGDFRVKLVDIDYEKDVGYIAIAEDREGMGGRLVKGRYYR